MTISAPSLLPYKIGAALIVIAILIGAGYYFGHSSRDSEVLKLNEKVTTCETLTQVQNAAALQLKTEGDAQNEKVLAAQMKASLMATRLSKAMANRPPVADDDALKWGEEKARELSQGW